MEIKVKRGKPGQAALILHHTLRIAEYPEGVHCQQAVVHSPGQSEPSLPKRRQHTAENYRPR